MPTDQVLMTTSEVADALNVSPSTVARWVRLGRLSAVVLPSGRLRFRPEDIDALTLTAVAS